MGALTILKELQQRGASVTSDRGVLYVSPVEAIDPAMRDSIRANKGELLALIESCHSVKVEKSASDFLGQTIEAAYNAGFNEAEKAEYNAAVSRLDQGIDPQE